MPTTPQTTKARPKSKRIEFVMSSYQMRLLLSVLILVSICPFRFVYDLWWAFFAVFGIEFGVRIWLQIAHKRAGVSRRDGLFENVALLFDFMALVSFLPLAEATGWSGLRLARFVRLFVLFGYWAPTFRQLWTLLNRRERTRQLRLLVAMVSGGTFLSAVLLSELARGIDPSELGVDGALTFADLLWWSFLQLEDPGNLIQEPDHFGILMISIVMTVGGIFLFSFVVGLGSSVVTELLETSNERPQGMRNHSVLINAGDHTHFFLDQLVRYYAKQIQRPRWVVMGSERTHPEITTNPHYRSISYRQGTPYHADDLAKVDTATAKRIVILASHGAIDADPETVSAVLSIREANPNARIYAEIHNPQNALAVLAAGGSPRTDVVSTEHLLAAVEANLLAAPELGQLIDELLTTRGNEIYTFIFKPTHFDPLPRRTQNADSYLALMSWAYQHHGCLLIGTCDPTVPSGHPDDRRFFPVLNPTAESPRKSTSANKSIEICGLIGITGNFRTTKLVGEQMAGRMQPIEANVPNHPKVALPRLRVPHREPSDARILICGFHARTVRLLEHLVRFQTGAEVFVMVRSATEQTWAREQLLAVGTQLDLGVGTPEAGHLGRFETVERPEIDGYSFDYMLNDPVLCAGQIHLIEGDWSKVETWVRTDRGSFGLANLDQVLIQSGLSGQRDPDASTVLTLLNLANLYRSEAHQALFKPGFRVVAEIYDPLKADLLDRRFSDATEQLPLTVVTTERIRNILMFQATVVPTFPEIFLDLFGGWGQGVMRLELDQPFEQSGSVRFAHLLYSVFQERREILLAIEIEGPEGDIEVIVAPQPDADRGVFRYADIRALLVIGRVDPVHPLDPANPDRRDPDELA